jgi:hypothetical protein
MEFVGDNNYSINCTGDACVGDEVCFSRAKFKGSWRKPKFDGYELVAGKIIADSYGAQKQQHTFTILLDNGENTLIKGRNLYANGLYRKPWTNECERSSVLDEKHERGTMARSQKEYRKAMGL